MKLDFLTFFVSAFATYRATVIVSRDIGPWGVFRWLRSKSKLAKCPFCVSIYIGGATSLCLYWSGFVMPLPMWFILSLAFSAITIMADRAFTADHNPQ